MSDIRKKIGRNDPCWCGSGLKYKYCHLDREKQEPPKIYEVTRELRKYFEREYCLVPDSMRIDCSPIISKAHTVPKSSLRHISRNGHVYSCVPNLEKLIKLRNWQPELIGINEASTFTGFCTKHDDAIFSKVEKQAFTGSQEQCFLLAYRGLAREFYLKKGLFSSAKLRHQLDKGKPFEMQYAFQQFNERLNKSIYKGIQDLEHYKTLFYKSLLNRNYDDFRSLIILLKSPPPIMGSSAITPEQDFEGNELQDLSDPNVISKWLCLTSFCSRNRGFIVFTWLSECDDVCKKVVNSLRSFSTNRLTDALIRFFFESFENLYIKPEWWEHLAEKEKTILIKRMHDGTQIEDRDSACLIEDGINYDNWSISEMKTIGF